MIVLIRKNVLLSLIFLTFCVHSWGQNDPYRAEIGVQAGLNIYTGDVNTIADGDAFANNLGNAASDFGVIFRYRFNQRLALRLGYDFTRVKGIYTYKDQLETYYTKLNNPLHVFDLWGEFNFFDLENNPYKRFSKRFSPFIFGGIGGMLTPEYKSLETNSNFTITIPFGVGFKLKMGERWNMNILFTNRLLLGDGMEGISGLDNPIPKTTSNPMNNDMLSGLSIGFTYDFWKSDCDCHQPITGKKPATQKVAKQKRASRKR